MLIFNTHSFFGGSKLANEKTWEHFKTHFLEALAELCQQQQMLQQPGYQVNHINTVNDKNIQQYQETAKALANLATATSGDHKALEQLSNTIANLTQQIKDKDTDKDTEISSLKNLSITAATTTTIAAKHPKTTTAFIVGHMATSSSTVTKTGPIVIFQLRVTRQR